MDTVRAFFGREKDTSKRTYMIFRQRIDFVIILAVGGVLSSVYVFLPSFWNGVHLMCGALFSVDAFGTLSDQIFAPYGYSPTFAGLTAAVLLGFGLLTAIVTAPLLDRVFMKRMGLTIKLLSLPVGTGWLALIWAVKPGNTAGIFVIMGLIGAGSLTMLPVGLEMAVEVTRNAEGSAALINMLVALEGVIFVQSESLQISHAVSLDSCFCSASFLTSYYQSNPLCARARTPTRLSTFARRLSSTESWRALSAYPQSSSRASRRGWSRTR